jgi:hypothetical protein
MNDMVNHPKHYTGHSSGVECIEVTRWLSFNRGNAFKYIFRHRDKGTPVQDLEKALWYVRDEIEHYDGLPDIPRCGMNALRKIVEATEKLFDIHAFRSIAEGDLNVMRNFEGALIRHIEKMKAETK